MMRIAWLTDIHLNFLNEIHRYEFYEKIIQSQVDCLFITGDIAEAPSLSIFLFEMEKLLAKPIYFVLGNHDYFRGDISSVRNKMRHLTSERPFLNWLPAIRGVKLQEGIYLIGHDGWADGRFGDYQHSSIIMNDSQLIADLLNAYRLGKSYLLEKMQALAAYDCDELRENFFRIAMLKPSDVIILLHVPPFKENCLYKGEGNNEYFLPFYASQIAGDTLLEIADVYPEIKFLVLCGHVHHRSVYQPRENLIIKSGHAEYYYPRIEEIIEI
ncbi:metallophosphoesterase family protein [Legionella brunensis]|uniref:Phosphoesterase n=1 Tax=Legionella brunensis TaxID=29422 RepID=A0A0W0STB8_9GAMM|nr:metallophosphoesterase [Legionella brunensis]KTC86635.1 phosphoesterase [Legionella brunensis]